MKKLYFNIEKCLACRTCEMVCCVGHSLNKDLFKDTLDKTLIPARIKVASAKIKNYPVACRHCDDPKCVVACMAAALKKDAKTGQVIHDKDKCVGCGMCITSCGRNVFGFDKEKNKSVVARPNNCMVGCTSCETWCIFNAISFPDKQYVKNLIKEKGLLAVAKKELVEKFSNKECCGGSLK